MLWREEASSHLPTTEADGARRRADDHDIDIERFALNSRKFRHCSAL